MTTFKNKNIAAMNLDAVVKHVEANQTSIAKTAETYRKRSRTDFSLLMLEARTVIKTIEQSVSLNDQAELLTRYQIRAALNGTSSYTPWIKLLFGKRAADNKQVKFGGQEHTKWEPDTSYARYFNFFEVIDRDFKGKEDELLDWVMEKGGPSTIVEKELARKRGEAQPNDDTKKERRDLYLAEAHMPTIELPEGLIASKEEFVGIILQKTEHGFRFAGVSKENANADFDRLAEKQFDALTKVQADRAVEQAAARKLEEAKKQGAREVRERMAASMGLTVEQWEAKFEQMRADSAAAFKPSADQQNVG